MSFRSALSAPSTQSGSIGTVLTGANPASPYTIVTATPQTLDSVSLPAGVWSIQLSEQVALTASTVTNLKLNLVAGSAIVYSTALIQESAVAVTETYTFSDTATIVLSATTVVSVNVTSTFTGAGSIVIDNPVTTSTQYITATKMA
jgi:hypothetical protein